jgi:hypothetical protein
MGRGSGFQTPVIRLMYLFIKFPGLLQAMRDILAATRAADADPTVKAIIITGEGTKAFAAGADIKEMAGQPYAQVQLPTAAYIS